MLKTQKNGKKVAYGLEKSVLKTMWKTCLKLVELLKHSVVLKFNNVEKLKTMLKVLKTT